MRQVLLEVKNLTKIYDGGILANHNINFDVEVGEIHSLVGENGAGKSTLMKILYGIESLTSGSIYFQGKELFLSSAEKAIEKGIGMVHQHFMLIESFDAILNITLGLKKNNFFINNKKVISEVKELASKYNFEIDFGKKVKDMNVSMKQKIEILKILYRRAKLIILDEPTAVLTPQETEELFERLLELKKNGITIIFISHKLDEVKKISDRITILKSGSTKGTFKNNEISEEEIARLMIGNETTFEHQKRQQVPKDTILKINNLSYVDNFNVEKLNNINLEVKKGEIVGIAGIEGNGQNELVNIIVGNIKNFRGEIFINNKDVKPLNIFKIRRNGLSYVAEDRMIDGCSDIMSLSENLISNNVDCFVNKIGLLDFEKIKKYTDKLIYEFDIKAKDGFQKIGSLSGGNIQKAIIAREFKMNSDLIVLNQPTRGVDIGAISFIHSKIFEMRSSYKGILLLSANLDELLSLSDRILVMYKGKVVVCLSNYPKLTEEKLGMYMLGLKKEAGEKQL